VQKTLFQPYLLFQAILHKPICLLNIYLVKGAASVGHQTAGSKNIRWQFKLETTQILKITINPNGIGCSLQTFWQEWQRRQNSNSQTGNEPT
jgi:hypothetical protein